MGNAVVAAAKDARKQLLDLVADHWDEKIEDLDIVDGIVISLKSEQEISVKEIGIYGLPNENYEGWKGGPIVGRGSFMPSYVTNLDFETGQGDRAVVHYTTGAQAFDIEIDKETGRIEVIKAASAFDVGRAINPDLVRAQIEGGLVQGYSSAIFEQMILKDGAMLNPSFVDYRIATSVDIPVDHHIDIIEVPQDDGPWGARGIGEHPMVPTIAALGNAIYNATGFRLKSPPFSAEKIYLAMLDAGLVE
jgi:carbon-monoxide dehydrogenase large subunit